MGLQEKRAIKAAEDGWLPKRQSELDGLAGTSVPFEIDWDSFEGDVKGIEWLEANGPAQVINAFRVLCKDELGKEAVKESVKSVSFKNVLAKDDKSLTFEGGVLALSCAFSQSPGGRYGDREIRTLLESKL
jgi:hypothetical protein